jgi:hypothetical protein
MPSGSVMPRIFIHFTHLLGALRSARARARARPIPGRSAPTSPSSIERGACACSVRVALRYLHWAQEDEVWTYWFNGFSDATKAQLS